MATLTPPGRASDHRVVCADRYAASRTGTLGFNRLSLDPAQKCYNPRICQFRNLPLREFDSLPFLKLRKSGSSQIFNLKEVFRMRKLLSGGLAMFAGMVSVPAPGSMHPEQPAPVADHRLARLQAFFGKSDCPARAYSTDFLAEADQFSLDWRLLPSISYVESTGGKSARNNNLFGWNSGHASFRTARAGIHEVGYRLAHSHMYRKKNLDQLLAIYNPAGDYAQRVKSVMAQIAPTQ
jgi:hypothetical protein